MISTTYTDFSICSNRKSGKILENQSLRIFPASLFGVAIRIIRLQQTFKDDDGAIFFHYHRFVYGCALDSTERIRCMQTTLFSFVAVFRLVPFLRFRFGFVRLRSRSHKRWSLIANGRYHLFRFRIRIRSTDAVFKSIYAACARLLENYAPINAAIWFILFSLLSRALAHTDSHRRVVSPRMHCNFCENPGNGDADESI